LQRKYGINFTAVLQFFHGLVLAVKVEINQRQSAQSLGVPQDIFPMAKKQ
jgi:hypothetical protein